MFHSQIFAVLKGCHATSSSLYSAIHWVINFNWNEGGITLVPVPSSHNTSMMSCCDTGIFSISCWYYWGYWFILDKGKLFIIARHSIVGLLMHFELLRCPLCVCCKHERKLQHFHCLRWGFFRPQMLALFIQSQLIIKAYCHYILMFMSQALQSNTD